MPLAIPSKILFFIFFVMGDFTLWLLENIGKMVLRESVKIKMKLQ